MLKSGSALPQYVNAVYASFLSSTLSALSHRSFAHDLFSKENFEDAMSFMSGIGALGAGGYIFLFQLKFFPLRQESSASHEVCTGRGGCFEEPQRKTFARFKNKASGFYVYKEFQGVRM